MCSPGPGCSSCLSLTWPGAQQGALHEVQEASEWILGRRGQRLRPGKACLGQVPLTLHSPGEVPGSAKPHFPPKLFPLMPPFITRGTLSSGLHSTTDTICLLCPFPPLAPPLWAFAYPLRVKTSPLHPQLAVYLDSELCPTSLILGSLYPGTFQIPGLDLKPWQGSVPAWSLMNPDPDWAQP